MSPVRSMADGRTYDDRNDYDRSLKAQGLRIMDKGEETPAKREWRKPEVREILEREIRKHV